MEVPPSSPYPRLSLAVIILLQEKSQTINTVFHSMPQWCLSALPSDLAAHSSVSSALQAPSRCSLQGTASVSGCLDPPLSSGMHLLALGQRLIRLSFLRIMVAFCFPPFAIHLARSSLSYLSCCSHGRGLAVGSLCPCQLPRCFHSFLALVIGKKGPLVLVQCLSCPGSLMTNKRIRFSLKVYNHLLWFADTTFLVMKGGQREENFSPVPLEQSNMTVRNSGHSLMPHWSPPRWTAWKNAGAGRAPGGQPGGQWSGGDAPTSPLCLSRHGHLQKTRRVSCPRLGI